MIVDRQKYSFNEWQGSGHISKGICSFVTVPGNVLQFPNRKAAQALFHPRHIFHHSGVSGFEFFINLPAHQLGITVDVELVADRVAASSSPARMASYSDSLLKAPNPSRIACSILSPDGDLNYKSMPARFV